MSARRHTTLARLMLALTGVAGLSATAAAQPRDTLLYHGEAGRTRPQVLERSRVVATLTIDGECHEITSCQSVREAILEALECAGYDAWCEGYTIVVDTRWGEPRIRFRSHEYRLSVREECGELRLWVRPLHQHHEPVEVPQVRRDRYRIEAPAIIFDVRAGHGDKPGYDRSSRGYDRDERGYGQDRRSRDGREPSYREPARYETERFGVGLRIDDDAVRFDLDAGFFRDTSAHGRW